MRPRNEPNLRQLDPRLRAVQLQAGRYAGTWKTANLTVLTSDGALVCSAVDLDTAKHIVAVHNHFLPVLNQLLYRLRGSADLEK